MDTIIIVARKRNNRWTIAEGVDDDKVTATGETTMTEVQHSGKTNPSEAYSQGNACCAIRLRSPQHWPTLKLSLGAYWLLVAAQRYWDYVIVFATSIILYYCFNGCI